MAHPPTVPATATVPPRSPSVHPLPLSSAAALAGVVAVACALAVTAWTADDARIAYRAVAQLEHAGQLVWNPGERVQVFTSPLWVVILTGLHQLGGPVEVAAWVASGLATLGALALAWHATRGAGLAARAGMPLLVLASPTLVEHGISGLETPLVALLALAAWAAAEDRDRFRGTRRVLLFTALAATTRLDSLVLLAPLALLTSRRAHRVDPVRATAVAFQGLLPLLAWLLFATIWFGSPIPNTALAKLSTGIPLSWYLTQGTAYLALSARADPVLALLLLGGVGAALVRRRPIEQALALGVGLHVLYLLRVGGDFMVGRFLVAPTWICLVLLARGAAAGGPRGLAALVVVAAMGSTTALRTPYASAPCVPTAFDRSHEHGIADERAVYACGTSPWTCDGGMCFSRPAKAAPEVDAEEAGMAGWPLQARLSPMVYDTWALADPIRSRLPSRTATIGHFEREVPEGWDEVVMGDPSTIHDPRLRELAQRVQLATRGSLTSVARLEAMWSLFWEDLPFTGRLVREHHTWWAPEADGTPVCSEERAQDARAFVDDPVADWEVLGVTPACGARARLPEDVEVEALEVVVAGEATWEVQLEEGGHLRTVARFAHESGEPSHHRVPLEGASAEAVVLVAREADDETAWPRLGPVLFVGDTGAPAPTPHAVTATVD